MPRVAVEFGERARIKREYHSNNIKIGTNGNTLAFTVCVNVIEVLAL